MKKRISYFLFVMITIIPIIGQAQSGNNSPFSAFGLGDINDPQFLHLQQMGGVSTAFIDPYQINISNPASYAFLSATTFEVGLQSRFSRYSNLTESEGYQGLNLSYLALSMPLRNPVNKLFNRVNHDFDVALTFGLSPFSTVGYEIEKEFENDDTGNYTQLFIGDGGLYRTFIGLAMKYKNIGVGINMGYLFGKIRRESSLIFTENLLSFDNIYESDYSLRSFHYDMGIVYNLILNKDKIENPNNYNVLTIGVSGNTELGFSTDEVLFNRLENFLGGLPLIDTLQYVDEVREGGVLPSNISIGLKYSQGQKFGIGGDITFTNWDDYVNPSSPERLFNTKKISLGGYYRPNPVSITSFFHRVYYRFGVYLKEDQRRINSDNINAKGITFGLGLPLVFQRKVSHINLGFDLGQRGDQNILKENYFKVSLGFTFNDDEWFIKRKFN